MDWPNLGKFKNFSSGRLQLPTLQLRNLGRGCGGFGGNKSIMNESRWCGHTPEAGISHICPNILVSPSHDSRTESRWDEKEEPQRWILGSSFIIIRSSEDSDT